MDSDILSDGLLGTFYFLVTVKKSLFSAFLSIVERLLIFIIIFNLWIISSTTLNRFPFIFLVRFLILDNAISSVCSIRRLLLKVALSFNRRLTRLTSIPTGYPLDICALSFRVFLLSFLHTLFIIHNRFSIFTLSMNLPPFTLPPLHPFPLQLLSRALHMLSLPRLLAPLLLCLHSQYVVMST